MDWSAPVAAMGVAHGDALAGQVRLVEQEHVAVGALVAAGEFAQRGAVADRHDGVAVLAEWAASRRYVLTDVARPARRLGVDWLVGDGGQRRHGDGRDRLRAGRVLAGVLGVAASAAAKSICSAIAPATATAMPLTMRAASAAAQLQPADGQLPGQHRAPAQPADDGLHDPRQQRGDADQQQRDAADDLVRVEVAVVAGLGRSAGASSRGRRAA